MVQLVHIYSLFFIYPVAGHKKYIIKLLFNNYILGYFNIP